MSANFVLNIINNTGGAVTFNGATNGTGSPASSSGNPPVINQYIPVSSTVNSAVQACGGSYWYAPPNSPGHYNYPDTAGIVSYNLPDGSVVSFTWDVAESGTASCTGGISAPTSYTVGLTNSGGTYTATLAPMT